MPSRHSACSAAGLVELLGIQFGSGASPMARLALTLGLAAAVTLVRLLVIRVVRLVRGASPRDRVTFWVRQGASLAAFVVLLTAVLSIWFHDARQLQTVIGFATAGLAIASQRVVTAFTGYLVIVRGNNFTPLRNMGSGMSKIE
jgi:hypothetical protein